MHQINLLPSELKPDKKVGLIIKKAEKYFVVLLVIYLILLGSAYFLKESLNKSLIDYQAKKTESINELKGLVNVETSTVYIRDRADKYRKLKDKDIELTNLNLFETSHSVFPPDSKINKVEISENNISYDVSVTSLASFSRIINGIVESGLYKEITLSPITHKAEGGYEFNLKMDF